MKRNTFVFAVMALAMLIAGPVSADAENLTYRVLYHLGFIEKTIATAYVETSLEGNAFFGTVNGHSIPWGGREYTVSDTLRATMTPDPSVKYGARESIDYINGWYSKPYAKDVAAGRYDRNDPANYKNIFGQGELDASPETMEAVTVTADMLGMFYYFRKIDFTGMSVGEKIRIPVANAGNKGRVVEVTYGGTSSYNPGSGEEATYNVTFEYSYDGQMCNYPVSCQVSQRSRVPLLLSAQLKIGHVEMILNQ